MHAFSPASARTVLPRAAPRLSSAETGLKAAIVRAMRGNDLQTICGGGNRLRLLQTIHAATPYSAFSPGNRVRKLNSSSTPEACGEVVN